MSFLVVSGFAKTMLLINPRKNQVEIDRGNAVAMLQIHHIRSISEKTFHAKSNVLFGGASSC